jgi:hypothetical protein
MPSVFISYSSKDLAAVEQNIVAPLREHDAEIWYSTEEIKTTAEWERQILDGLKNCDWVLVVLTPQAVASKWVKREIHWAVEKREGRIIPLMLETCEPDELHIGLFSLQYIDFRDGISKGQKKLLAFLNFVNAKEERIQNQTEQAQQKEQGINRVRYDTPSNWAIVSVGITVLYVFNSPNNPHFVVPIISLLVAYFLLLEIKRGDRKEKWGNAIAQRLLGGYLWIFILLDIVWGMKLYVHPSPAFNLNMFIERAQMVLIPGWLMIFVCVIMNLIILFLALSAIRLKRKL